MADNIGTGQHPVHIIGITQVTDAHFTVKFGNKLSTVATGCDNMQVFVTDLDQLFKYMAADEAGSAGNKN